MTITSVRNGSEYTSTACLLREHFELRLVEVHAVTGAHDQAARSAWVPGDPETGLQVVPIGRIDGAPIRRVLPATRNPLKRFPAPRDKIVAIGVSERSVPGRDRTPRAKR